MPKPQNKQKFTGRKPKVVENPFEKFANSRKKHDVLNRRVKGEDRNVGRARKKAVEDRKKTLMSDFIASKKSNTFSDRRFGENDPNLTLEDKLFQRFQREKMKKVKKVSKFALDSTSEVVLTHGGQALGESNFDDKDWNESSDDENLANEAVNRLHFGGGLVETGKSGDDFATKKTHADVLQEIVMKSKMFKLEKKEAKDAQENQRELVDKAYEDLVNDALLEFKPTKRDRSEMSDPSENADQYDSILRSLAFESKVQASNRTQSAEEIEKAERKKQEQLESERVKRMKMEHIVLPSANQHKDSGIAPTEMNDDCIYELYEDYTARNQPRGGNQDQADYSDDSLDDSDMSESEEEEETTETSSPLPLPEKERAQPSSNKDMPAMIDYPKTVSEFEELCNLHAADGKAGSLTALLERIHISSNKADDRTVGYFKVLLDFAIKTGNSMASAASDSDESLQLIDTALSSLFGLANDSPDLHLRTIQKFVLKLNDEITSRLKECAAGSSRSCWPSLGSIVILQFLGVLFSTSDFRHGVVGPAMVLMCRCLAQCPVVTCQDLSFGTLISSIILNYTEYTKEIVPELSVFIHRALETLDQHQIILPSQLDNILKGNAKKCKAIYQQKVKWSSFDARVDNADSPDDSIRAACFFFKMVACFHRRYREESHHGPFFQNAQTTIFDFFKKNSSTWKLFVEKMEIGLGGDIRDEDTEKTFKPLQWRKPQKKVDMSVAPAFDLHYTMKKPSHDDADVEKLKALKRQLKREKKASMRELRKDSLFLGTEAHREKMQRKSDIRDERAKNYAWLQDQHATFNQQVRMGKMEMKGGGTGGVKTTKKRR